jgi:hypothetical protein
MPVFLLDNRQKVSSLCFISSYFCVYVQVKLQKRFSSFLYHMHAFIITGEAWRKWRPNDSTNSEVGWGRLPTRFSTPINLTSPNHPISCRGSGSASWPRCLLAGSAPQFRCLTWLLARTRTASQCCWGAAPLAWGVSAQTRRSLLERRSARRGFCSRLSAART